MRIKQFELLIIMCNYRLHEIRYQRLIFNNVIMRFLLSLSSSSCPIRIENPLQSDKKPRGVPIQCYVSGLRSLQTQPLLAQPVEFLLQTVSGTVGRIEFDTQEKIPTGICQAYCYVNQKYFLYQRYYFISTVI